MATYTPVTIAPLDLLAGEVGSHCLHGEVAHFDRVLHDDALQLAVGQPVDEGRVRIEHDGLHLAGERRVFQGAKQPAGIRLAHGEDARRAAAEPVQHVGRLVQGQLGRRAGVLILRNDFHLGELFSQRVEKALLALLGALAAWVVAQQVTPFSPLPPPLQPASERTAKANAARRIDIARILRVISRGYPIEDTCPGKARQRACLRRFKS